MYYPSIRCVTLDRCNLSHLVKRWELIFVRRCDSDDLISWLYILGHAARISSVLIQTSELWDLVVLILQHNRDTSVIVQGVGSAVL